MGDSKTIKRYKYSEHLTSLSCKLRVEKIGGTYLY